MQSRRKRFWVLISMVASLLIAAGLILYALSQNIDFYRTPTEIKQMSVEDTKRVRLGGMVAKGSVVRDEGLNVSFQVTDFNENLHVDYEGILPDLFREGQGIVVEGHLSQDGRFKAKMVLAKHDEKYMPPEINKKMHLNKGQS